MQMAFAARKASTEVARISVLLRVLIAKSAVESIVLSPISAKNTATVEFIRVYSVSTQSPIFLKGNYVIKAI